MPPVAAEILGIFNEKSDATHHWGTSPAGYYDMAILSSGFQPFVTSLTTFHKCRDDGAEEFAVLGSVVIHYPAYALASVGRVKGIVLLLTSLSGGDSFVS